MTAGRARRSGWPSRPHTKLVVTQLHTNLVAAQSSSRSYGSEAQPPVPAQPSRIPLCGVGLQQGDQLVLQDLAHPVAEVLRLVSRVRALGNNPVDDPGRQQVAR